MVGTNGSIYVHVGMPKTGTSYLQSVYHNSAEQLSLEGLALAPPTRREAFWLSLAIRDGLHPERDPAAALHVLERFAEQVKDAEAERLLVSDELLGAASPVQIERLLEACRPREVHLVLTVRSLARLLPSTWQQRIQQGSEAPALDDFLDAVVDRQGRIGARWWDERGVQNVIERWSQYVPLDRVHVVTVPSGPSSEELLQRYSTVLGVNPARLSTGAPRENASLGYAEAELLRLVRDRIPRGLLNRHEYVPVGKRWLAQRHLAPLGGPPPRMPLRLRTWCEAEAQSTIDYVRHHSLEVVGDLEDLRPLPEDFHDGSSVSSDELVEVAVRALASIALERLDDQREERPTPRVEGGSLARWRQRGRRRFRTGRLKRKRP
ncbi:MULTISPECIES: hypothetical protein [unclassified Nocardioides]|uniref:hypothetical protein n=1 Tax=unclassified Nocardioides TaxID=2615069 RepID=UPI0009F0277C|nr:MULTISPECIES: hypothetical protein [unclassified Nocardioides]GAW51159.1 uncharacterized protein (Precursor) [Nocardioides sp. PD653-B2]GAW56887.1 uncharacterized protein (Precursor) [Nocardioides sp. PD653]